MAVNKLSKLLDIDFENMLSGKQILILHAIFFGITAAVILNTEILFLADYMDYLARIHIYNNLPENPAMAEFYSRDMKLTPYLAFFTIVSNLEPYLGIYNAGKVYILTAMLTILLGGLFLNRTLHKKTTFWTLSIHAFLFNTAFSMGFVNFYLGLGLILFGIALWIKYTDTRNTQKLKFYCLFAVYGLFIYFCHIFSLLLLGVFIGLFELFSSDIKSFKSFIKSSLLAASKVLSFTLLPMLITPAIAIIDMGLPVATRGFGIKTTYFSYIAPLTLNNPLIAIITITLLVSLFLLKSFEKSKLSYPILTLLLIATIAPFFFLGIAFANIRIPIFICLVLASSMVLKQNISGLQKIFSASFITALLTGYTYHLNMVSSCSNVAESYLNQFKDDSNFEGKRILTVIEKVPSKCFRYSFGHISSLIAIENNVFIPEMITGIPPLKANDAYQAIDGKMSNPVPRKILEFSNEQLLKNQKDWSDLYNYEFNFYFNNWRQDFDYISYIYGDKKPANIPDNLELYKEAGFFSIYKNKNRP